MFADFRTATRGTGKSFKGALDYFLNDKGEGTERPTTDERVDVLELRNLATNNPRNAWFEMMNTAQASEALKAAAGIARGGRKGEKPVFTYHLAWHDSENPDRTAMLDAAKSTLKLFGLEHHQAIVVSHKDTAHPHLHVIVNRVDPENGRYAGLSNSWKNLKQWAIDYSKEHGTSWHIPLEQAKDAREQRRQTERQDAFNRGAEGKPARPAEKKPAASRRPGRAEWEVRSSAGNDNRPGEADAAAALKAELAGKWAALRGYENSTVERERAEKARLWTDRKAERDAIYAKYREASDAIWKQPRAKPAVGQRPSPLAEKTLKDLSRRRRQFEQQERSILGKLANAGSLMPGRSMFAVIRLALNRDERRRLFDQAQRQIASQGRQPADQTAKRGQFTQTRKEQADRLKAMRVAELARFDAMTVTLRQQMAERHQVQSIALSAMKASLSASGKQAWAKHAAVYRDPQQRPAREKTAGRPQDATRGTAARDPVDRFGRSRDRKPRQPRGERQDRQEGHPEATMTTGQREGRGGTSRPFNEAAEAAEAASRTEADTLARVRARRAAERAVEERGDNRGPGRERE